MKNKLFLLLAICILQFMVLNVSASQPLATVTYASGHSTATDGGGNVYVSGYFSSSTITFGTITITKTNTVSGTKNVFLVKYDPAGNVLWAINAGGNSGDDEPYGLVTDGSGNVYMTGMFDSPSITFFSAPPYETTITLSSGSSFLVKYDPNGNLQWVDNPIGNPGWQGIALAGGNLYLTGSFSGTVTSGEITLISQGGVDVFTAGYDLNGNLLWAKSAGGTGDDTGEGIVTDASGNVYITGWFTSPSMKFGTYTLTNKGSSSTYDIFFAKYDAYGNLQWATSADGSSYDFSWSIASDAGGNSYITGSSTSASLTFYSATSSGKTITVNGPSKGLVCYFIVMYDQNGNAIWAKNAGGSGSGQGVATYPTGNVYVTGTCNSSTTFGSPNEKPSPNPVLDLFLVKYNSTGSVQWVQNAGGTSGDATQDAATDGSGNVLITGHFSSSTVTFGTITLTDGNSGDWDMFIAKYDPTGKALWAKSVGAPHAGTMSKPAIAGINDPTANEITVYPNPTAGKVTLSTDAQSVISGISVFNMIGKEVLSRQSAVGGQQVEIDLSSLPKGIYIVRIRAGENYYQKKIILN